MVVQMNYSAMVYKHQNFSLTVLCRFPRLELSFESAILADAFGSRLWSHGYVSLIPAE